MRGAAPRRHFVCQLQREPLARDRNDRRELELLGVGCWTTEFLVESSILADEAQELARVALDQRSDICFGYLERYCKSAANGLTIKIGEQLVQLLLAAHRRRFDRLLESFHLSWVGQLEVDQRLHVEDPRPELAARQVGTRTTGPAQYMQKHLLDLRRAVALL